MGGWFEGVKEKDVFAWFWASTNHWSYGFVCISSTGVERNQRGEETSIATPVVFDLFMLRGTSILTRFEPFANCSLCSVPPEL